MRVVERILGEFQDRRDWPFRVARLPDEFVRESTLQNGHFAEELKSELGLGFELERTIFTYLTTGNKKHFERQGLKACWDVSGMGCDSRHGVATVPVPSAAHVFVTNPSSDAVICIMCVPVVIEFPMRPGVGE
jgi:hypothetical protein